MGLSPIKQEMGVRISLYSSMDRAPKYPTKIACLFILDMDKKTFTKNLLKNHICDFCHFTCKNARSGFTCERYSPQGEEYLYYAIHSVEEVEELNGQNLRFDFTHRSTVKGLRFVDSYNKILNEITFSDGPYEIPEAGGSITCLNLKYISGQFVL